ncbi:DUF421 domain-containing protein [Bacillus niameyensis]|uniref:DUF421 domain-containing protein n=1 Tax=Bacillus niameyensis TaxID=1522308 RepID=UPI00078340B6|nr:YetF domain-containing protein [Bacillus niameyensis]
MEFLNLIIKFPLSIAFLFIAIRIMGMKEVAQATAIDFAFAVLAASIVWDMALEPKYSIWHMIVILVILVVIMYAVDWLAMKYNRAEKYMIGKPKLIIKDGQVDQKCLKEERMSIEELESRLRVVGVFEIETVEIAYLELTGEISVKERSK